MTYFDIENIGRIFLDIKDNKIEYKKMNGNNLVSLSKKELELLENIINTNDNCMNGDIVDMFINDNESLIQQKEILTPLLNCIEMTIPEQYDRNFYTNLSTLKIEFINFSEIEDEHLRNRVGFYNYWDNTIFMNKEYINYLKNKAQPEIFMYLCNKNLLHELLHMASSSYDEKTNVFKTGFDITGTNDFEKRNIGLTEGMTELITFSFLPNLNGYLISGYYTETSLADQLSLLVGDTLMLNCYFGNLGNEPLKEKLKGIYDDTNQITKLFTFMELNFILNKSTKCKKQKILAEAQSILVDYFTLKIKKDTENNIPKEQLKAKLEMFKKALITEEKLMNSRNNHNLIIGINKSVEKFNTLEEELQHEFSKAKQKKYII